LLLELPTQSQLALGAQVLLVATQAVTQEVTLYSVQLPQQVAVGVERIIMAVVMVVQVVAEFLLDLAHQAKVLTVAHTFLIVAALVAARVLRELFLIIQAVMVALAYVQQLRVSVCFTLAVVEVGVTALRRVV
jgi:hypothetical protein